MAAEKHGLLNRIQEFLLDPDKGLFTHKFFWTMAFGPVLSGVVLGYPVWEPYSLSLTKEGYMTFIEVSKLPLAIMALGLPFGAVAASFHRSLQTSKQIRAAERREIVSYKSELHNQIAENAKSTHLAIEIIFQLQDLVGFLKTFSKTNLHTIQFKFHAEEIMTLYKKLYEREIYYYYNADAQNILRSLHGHIYGIHSALIYLSNLDLKKIDETKRADLPEIAFPDNALKKVESNLESLLEEVYSVIKSARKSHDDQIASYDEELKKL